MLKMLTHVILGYWDYGLFLFSSFCICVVSKFSAVNMYNYYNKEKIETMGLAKCCLDSLTRDGLGRPSCKAAFAPRVLWSQMSPAPITDCPGCPELGRADSSLFSCGSWGEISLAGQRHTVNRNPEGA